MPDIDKDVQKEAVKEALREWLDEKFAELGKWTFTGLAAAAFAGAVYLAVAGMWGKK